MGSNGKIQNSGASNTNPQAPDSGFEEIDQLSREYQQGQSALLLMLIEDARSGTIKDPKGRNINGRRDKKTASNQPKLGIDAMNTETEAADRSASLGDTSSDEAAASSAAIKGASASLKRLGAATNTNFFGPDKLVDVREFV